MTKSIVALAALLLSCGTSPSAPADAAADVAADAQAPGAHVVQIDFGDTIDPTGNGVLVPLSQQGKTLPNLIDFATGQPTPLSLTTATWTTAGVDAKNWTAGDVDWLLAVVAQDALDHICPLAQPFQIPLTRYRVIVAFVFDAQIVRRRRDDDID